MRVVHRWAPRRRSSLFPTIDLAAGNIGTATADDAVPDNLPGDADHAFVGQHQKLYEHQGLDCGLGASSGLGIGQGMLSSSNCMYGLGGIALELFVPTGGGLIQGGTRAGAILLEAYAAYGRGSTVVDWAKIVSGAGSGG